MKATHRIGFISVKKSQFWLLSIASSLMAIYMTLVWRSGDTAHFGMSILFLLAVGSLLWEKRHSLILESQIFSRVLGGLIIAVALWRSIDLTDANFLRVFPFISGLGVALLAADFKGLKQYWQELTILFFLGVPSVLISSLVDPSPFTAKFSGFLLWYSGFKVSVQDVYINLPTGGIKVYGSCAGTESITYLLGLSVVCLVMFPIEGNKKIWVPIVAIAIGYLVNAFRVSLMAVLSASGNQESFKYWHEGDGSLIFGAIAVIAFGLFYLFLMRQSDSENDDYAPESK
ncbi:MAG TPA: cyanoexosortase A [Cyanobacteria bacterium UBA11372]|nr:cyanoexosortase A [Cyanobacteria bacterium UBA11372]